MRDRSADGADTKRGQQGELMAASVHGTRAWRRAAEQAKMRAGYRCQQCGHTGAPLYAHHIDEQPDGPRALDPTNIIVLCAACHLDQHGSGARRYANG